MAKKKDNAPGKLRGQAREQLAELGYEKLIEDFQLFDPFGDGSMDATADLVAMDGDEPVILFAAADPGDAARPSIQDDAKFKAGLGADEGKPFRFVWVWDGDNNFIFDLEKDAQISDLPRKDLWREIAKPISDSRSRLLQDLSAEYHRGDFRAIQRKFDQLHDAIYSRGGIKPTNAAIDELGKLLFLRIHLEKSPRYKIKDGAGKGKLFSEIYSSEYVKKNGKKAVIELKDAFREINNLPQYNAKDITGEAHTIFSYDEPLRLENPEILAMAIDSMDLRDRDGQPIRLSVPDKELVGNGEQARMMRAHLIHEDLLGWAFDVFLRGKYASNEGLATYLTPSQVVECMTNMVFHDITDAELWARRGDKDQQERWSSTKDGKDLPAFLCGDICCGTGRFLVGALREIKKRILDDKHVGHSDEDKLAWLSQMKRHSFFGADQAEGSIQKARINMLLYGEDHTQLLKVDDSITDTHVDELVGKFDLILTNPPFGSGKYDDPIGMAKMRKEELGLELGWKWKAGDRSKKKAIDKADPAALFVDRNLQLLKPGGRLLIVVPDGILCNSGDAYIREYIMGSKDEETGEFLGGKAILKAVVSLPTETFAISGTGAKTSFIYLQKKKHASEKQGPVFMAMAEHVGYIKKGKSEIPDPEGNDLNLIPEIYTSIDKDNHQPTRFPCSWVDTDKLSLLRLDSRYYSPQYLIDEEILSKPELNTRPLGDLAKLVKDGPGGWAFKASEYTDLGIPVIRASDIKGTLDLSEAVYITEDRHNDLKQTECLPGDLVISVRGTPGRTAIVPKSVEKANINAAVVRVRLKKEYTETSHFLTAYMNSQIGRRVTERIANGAVQNNINLTEVRSIPVPLPEDKIKKYIAKKVIMGEVLLKYANQLLKESKRDVESLLNGKLDTDAILSGKLKAPTWEDIEKELEGIKS